MDKINEHNMLKILQDGLAREIKEAVTDQLIKDELARYKEQLRPIIDERVNKLCFKSIESIREMSCMRDELHVFLNWEGAEGPVTREIPPNQP